VFATLLLATPGFAEILAAPITYTKSLVDGMEQYTFSNSCGVPVSLKLSLDLKNAAVAGPSDLIVVPAHATVTGPAFHCLVVGQPWEYHWTYRYNFGSYQVSQPSEPFELPWAVGDSHTAGQAFGGDLSHMGDDRYAVDFPMPEGTPVYAARDGLVCYLREEYSEGGWRQELRDKDNHILIAHQDGTISRYLHIRHDGAVVELGQWVKAGQLIGYSGNVGFSSVPHLHFDVVRPGKDLLTQTVPFQFVSGGVPVTPETNMVLYHAPRLNVEPQGW
jgi:murein DD-endopeptidase MepM/ murein hydrolase activator NlpD